MKASHGLVCLALGILLYFIALEVIMRTAVPRISQIERRHRVDREEALKLTRAGHGGAKTVLIVGNSLLQQGIDRPELENALSQHHHVTTYAVENTTYWDWYFGLRRLEREGSAPDVVVLSLNLRQVLADSTNGEGFAHSLMWMGDVAKVARTTGLDLTGASNYFFANISAWLGGRSFIRNWILEKWVPDVNALVQYFTPATQTRSTQGSRTERAHVLIERLSAMRDLVETRGAQFLFLLPPSMSRDDFFTEFEQLATRAGITVIAPFKPGEIGDSAFSDGFHLNPDGAKRFSARLGQFLSNDLTSYRDRKY